MSTQHRKPIPSGPGMYEDLCEKTFDVVVRGGSEFMCRCIWHEDNSASLQFNVDKALYVCFGCGVSGNLRTLQKEMGVRFSEPEVDVSDILKRLDALDAKPVVTPILPESTLKRYSFPNRYWESRGFTQETIEAFDLGYDPMENTAIIPLRKTTGELVAFIRRFLDEDHDGPKYKMPLKEKYARSSNLFGAWLVSEDPRDEVVICEGPVDAMKVWQAGFPAVAQYGSSISFQQVRLLRRLGFNRAVLFYDNDKAGIRAAEGYVDNRGKGHPGAISMLTGFDLRRVVYKPTWLDDEGRRIKDPGGLPRNVIRKAIRTAPRV